MCFGQYPFKVGPADRRVDPAQEVVATKGDDQRVNLGGKGPGDARQPARRGIPGHTGVDESDVAVTFVQPTLQLRHEALFRGQPVPLRQAVAKGGDRDLFGPNR